MEKTIGTVVSVKKQWWLKINTKPVRAHAFDGAIFPHIVKVAYCVDGIEYYKKKWIRAGMPVPAVNTEVTVAYDKGRPSRSQVLDL